jgi:hypothetical protein
MRMVHEAWLRHRAISVPAGMEPAAERQQELLFKAGAAVMFQLLMRGLSEGEEATPTDMALMSALETECSEIGQALDAHYPAVVAALKRNRN